MNYKEANKKVYDTYACEFEKRTEIVKKHLLADSELFVENLSGKRVLDLGSGPGRDSLFFVQSGLKPLCFDISPKMIELCKNKGLEAAIGDLENLPFSDSSFDGVWACTSLLHMPKQNFHRTLERIRRILKENGIFYLSMKEGNFEGWMESDKYPGCQRFFSLYQDKELKSHLKDYFDVSYSSRVSVGNATFLGYLCKKN